MLIDIHVHSNHTDGCELALADLVTRACERGLDGFCLTDVHTVDGGPDAKGLAAENGIVALVGFEAHTDKGHFLVFVPEPGELPEISKWLRFDGDGLIPFPSLSGAVEDLHGVLIAAHPYDRDIERSPGDGIVQLKGVAALEVNNARRPKLVNELAEEVAAGIGMPGVAGSDARFGLEDIGRVACLVHEPVESEADLIDRIRSFNIWPVTIGAEPGDRQRPRRSRNSRTDRSRSAPKLSARRRRDR